MPRANTCCNPLGFDKNCNKNGDCRVTKNCNQKFHVLKGLFVCKSCKTLTYRKKDEIEIKKPIPATQKLEDSENNSCEGLERSDFKSRKLQTENFPLNNDTRHEIMKH